MAEHGWSYAAVLFIGFCRQLMLLSTLFLALRLTLDRRSEHGLRQQLASPVNLPEITTGARVQLILSGSARRDQATHCDARSPPTRWARLAPVVSLGYARSADVRSVVGSGGSSHAKNR
jgi:hypothetical protein